MTTVAWNEKEIAWDSLITMGDEKYVHTDCEKVVVHKGRIFTLCGNAGMLKKSLIPWWEKGHKPSEAPDGDWEMAVISHDGVKVYSSEAPHAEVDTPRVFAMGSGSMAARAALICNKTPVEAVEVAAQLDKGTGGPVQRLVLAEVVKPPTKRKKAKQKAKKK